MDLVALTEALKGVSLLDASLYGVALLLSLALRFIRAAFLWADDAHTLGAAGALGGVGALLVLTVEPRPWQFIALQSVALTVGVLIGERILRGMASKVPWLPADNQFVKDVPPLGGKDS